MTPFLTQFIADTNSSRSSGGGAVASPSAGLSGGSIPGPALEPRTQRVTFARDGQVEVYGRRAVADAIVDEIEGVTQNPAQLHVARVLGQMLQRGRMPVERVGVD